VVAFAVAFKEPTLEKDCVSVWVEMGESVEWSESYSRRVACLLRGGQVCEVVDCGVVEVIENCFLKTSAYVLLVVVYVGLSRWRGRREDGGSIPDGIDFRIIFSRFSSIQVRASGRLVRVVTRRDLLRPVDSSCWNQGLQRRCSFSEIGSVSDVA